MLNPQTFADGFASKASHRYAAKMTPSMGGPAH